MFFRYIPPLAHYYFNKVIDVVILFYCNRAFTRWNKRRQFLVDIVPVKTYIKRTGNRIFMKKITYEVAFSYRNFIFLNIVIYRHGVFYNDAGINAGVIIKIGFYRFVKA